MINVDLLLMVVAGAAVATQIAINAHLGVVAGSPLWAASISFGVTMAVGVLALAAAVLFGHPAWPAPALWNAPRWIWLGGLGGATYVLLAIVLTPRLGTTLLSAAGIFGQLAATMLIDHYGWFGVPVHRLSATRVMGVALLAVGVALIRWR